MSQYEWKPVVSRDLCVSRGGFTATVHEDDEEAEEPRPWVWSVDADNDDDDMPEGSGTCYGSGAQTQAKQCAIAVLEILSKPGR